MTRTSVIQQLLNVIGVEVQVETDIRFLRRLGARAREGGKRDTRPLLVGLVHKYHAELILQNCWKLGDC